MQQSGEYIKSEVYVFLTICQCEKVRLGWHQTKMGAYRICFIGWMVMALRILRLAYGAMLIAVLFLPFGLYNTMAEPYVSGVVWGFMIPVGYVAAASGAVVILYPRWKLLRRLGFGYLLMAVGVCLLLSLWLYPRELSVSLLHGTNMIDLDYSTFTGAVFWLSLLTVAAGIAALKVGTYAKS